MAKPPTNRLVDLPPALAAVLGLLAAVGTAGCSVNRFAINRIGDSLARSGTTYAADDDPDLVGQALPFTLKLVEGLLAESPERPSLLFLAASGFTEYAHAYVLQDADLAQKHDLERASALRDRARRLFLRGRNYGMRGLGVRMRGFSEQLRRDPAAAVRLARVSDVPLLYWTAAAWGSAISLSKDNAALIADQRIVEALIDRAGELQPDFDSGAIDGFLIVYEMARSGAPGDPAARARMHFDRAVALSQGQLASPFVSLAEAVSVQNQNRAEFASLLDRALAIDPDARPEWRLRNLVAQRRARWLLATADDLFTE